MPRELTLGAETVLRLSEADAALGRLAGAGRLLPNPHLLVNAYITREAVSSSGIEGTQASVTEVFDAAVTGETKRDDIREVRNYVAALQHGVHRMQDDGFPISLRLIREMHKILLTGVRGQDKTPGEFRTSQNSRHQVSSGRARTGSIRLTIAPKRRPSCRLLSTRCGRRSMTGRSTCTMRRHTCRCSYGAPCCTTSSRPFTRSLTAMDAWGV